jgi:predicted nucleic acid-binding protein
MVRSDGKPILVLDSFAALAVFNAEPAGPQVVALLEQAKQGEFYVVMSVINLGEVVYRLIREQSNDAALLARAVIEAWPVRLVDVDAQLALEAAEIKGYYALSYADCIAAALSLQLDGRVVTGDPEFHKIEDFVDVDWLRQRA